MHLAVIVVMVQSFQRGYLLALMKKSVLTLSLFKCVCVCVRVWPINSSVQLHYGLDFQNQFTDIIERCLFLHNAIPN